LHPHIPKPTYLNGQAMEIEYCGGSL